MRSLQSLAKLARFFGTGRDSNPASQAEAVRAPASSPKDHPAVQAAVREAIAGERARAAVVFGSPAYPGREALALTLLTKTNTPAPDIIAALALMPLPEPTTGPARYLLDLRRGKAKDRTTAH